MNPTDYDRAPLRVHYTHTHTHTNTRAFNIRNSVATIFLHVIWKLKSTRNIKLYHQQQHYSNNAIIFFSTASHFKRIRSNLLIPFTIFDSNSMREKILCYEMFGYALYIKHKIKITSSEILVSLPLLLFVFSSSFVNNLQSIKRNVHISFNSFM